MNSRTLATQRSFQTITKCRLLLPVACSFRIRGRDYIGCRLCWGSHRGIRHDRLYPGIRHDHIDRNLLT